VGAQPLGGEAEARTGASRRLEEEIDDDLALEVAAFLAAALADVNEVLGRIKNGLDFGPAPVFEAKQVTTGADDGLRLLHGEIDGHRESPAHEPADAHPSAQDRTRPARILTRYRGTGGADKEFRLGSRFGGLSPFAPRKDAFPLRERRRSKTILCPDAPC